MGAVPVTLFFVVGQDLTCSQTSVIRRHIPGRREQSVCVDESTLYQQQWRLRSLCRPTTIFCDTMTTQTFPGQQMYQKLSNAACVRKANRSWWKRMRCMRYYFTIRLLMYFIICICIALNVINTFGILRVYFSTYCTVSTVYHLATVVYIFDFYLIEQ